MNESKPKFLLNARVKEFTIPPITDGLIVGKNSPIGVNALKKALNLLIPDNFEQIKIDDDVIGDILIKSIIVRRLSLDRVSNFLISQVKSFMTADDILHIQMDTEISVSQELE